MQSSHFTTFVNCLLNFYSPYRSSVIATIIKVSEANFDATHNFIVSIASPYSFRGLHRGVLLINYIATCLILDLHTIKYNQLFLGQLSGIRENFIQIRPLVMLIIMRTWNLLYIYVVLVFRRSPTLTRKLVIMQHKVLNTRHHNMSLHDIFIWTYVIEFGTKLTV